MGNTTYGSIEAQLSRPLTEAEEVSWLAAVKAHEPEEDSTGWTGFEAFQPDGWCFTNDDWGDIGQAGLNEARDILRIEVGGKVYDTVAALTVMVALMPEDITAEGEGAFETEGEHWGLRVHGREVREVGAEVVVAPWDDRKPTTRVLVLREGEYGEIPPREVLVRLVELPQARGVWAQAHVAIREEPLASWGPPLTAIIDTEEAE